MENESRIQAESRRRISRVDEEKIQAAVAELLTVKDGDSEDVISKKNKRAAKVQAFREKYARVPTSKNAALEPKRLTFDNLREFLKTAGLSYKDLLEITNGENGERAQLGWNNKIERNMCSACDSLSPSQRAKVLEIVVSSLPTSMRDILNSGDLTGIKVFDVAEARTNAYDEIWLKVKHDQVLVNAYVYRNYPNRSCDVIPYSKFSDVASMFDVSFHWLLGLDESTCILAKHGDTEMIMDAFCLLPDTWKQIIYSGVKMSADRTRDY